MDDHRIPATRPGLMDAIADPLAMTAWELVRVRKRATLAEIAALTSGSIPAVQQSLDRLVRAGLLSAAPGRRGARISTYRVAVPEIRVDLADITSAEADAMVQRWTAGEIALFESITRPGTAPRDDSRKRGFGMEWAYLTDEEGIQLTGLVRQMFAIMFAAKDRHARAHEAGRAPAAGQDAAPYAMMLQILPVQRIPLPRATVVFCRQPTIRISRLQDDSSRRAALSKREQEVAEALVTGKTRPAVARALGLSPYTVVALTQRIYRKLGVKSRAELGRVIGSRL